MRILIIEDEKQMAEATAFILKKNNYTVDLSYDGQSGLDHALDDIYDVIVLDWMLPEINGISLLKEIRTNNITTPVILLTARSETDEIVTGLDAGADDYLTKPFKTAELLARIRALSKRKGEIISSQFLTFGDICLNPHNLEVSTSSKKINLTLKESQLLELLIESKKATLTKSRIIEKVWGYESDADEHHVEVYISFLRKKLKEVGTRVTIETIRGSGYRLKYEK